LLGLSEPFRDFVFSAYASRLSDLLMLIEEVAFGRIDVRLAGWLAARAGTGEPIRATHQEIAVELGTAREVVSRQLKEFERRGWVCLGRGVIGPSDPKALRQFGQGV
jgi:CRP/FNR family transcriptional regulator